MITKDTSNQFVHSWIKIPIAIGKVTFLEIIRDKILYNILLIVAGLSTIGVLASYMAYVKPLRVLKDFGLSATNISCLAIGILIGAGLLAKEIERRTIFVALSKPISQAQFLFGKYTGIAFVLAINWLFVSLATYAVILTFGYEWGNFSYLIYSISLFFCLLQSLLMAAIAVFFSTFTTTSLSVVFSVGILIIGNSISQLQGMITKMSDTATKPILKLFIALLPNLENFNLGLQMTYDLPITLAQFSYTFLYWILLTTVVLGVSGLLVKTREV